MSGPKVVRVVTREERLATYAALTAQLDAALAAMKADAARLGDAEGEELATSKQRKGELDALVSQDAFDQAERQIQQEIGFITAKKVEMIERAATAAALSREKASRRRHAAATLLKELERRASNKDADLLTSLKSIAAQAKPSEAADTVLSRAAASMVSDAPPAQLTDVQRALAQSLQSARDAGAGSTARWTASFEQDRRIAQLQRQLAQIEVLRDGDAAEAFSLRLGQLELETAGAGRDMRLDALVLDVAAAVASLKRDVEALEKASQMMAEVDALAAAELSGARQRLADALGRRDASAATSAMEEAATALAQARQQLAAEARRAAILTGLASLGYEVNETMSTSWAQDGRVVLRKDAADQHGVEVASAPDAQRLQVRAVTFSANSTLASNLAAEQTWCGDFTKLQGLLKQAAGGLAIEKAMPVGAVPLKVVQPPAATQATATAARSLRSAHR